MGTERYIERALTTTVVEAMSNARAVALLGARQAGKSTLVRRLASGPLAAEYVTLDHAPTLDLAQSDPVGFVADLKGRTVIDEVHREPRLLLAIKVQLDLDNTPGQFLLTGSANLRRIPTIPDALPGRVLYLTLWPLTQGEIAGVPESFLGPLFEGSVPRLSEAPPSREAYADRLLVGGFPEAQVYTRAARADFFDSYLTSIVDRDVADTSRIHKASAVATLLRVLAARSGALARYETLSRDVGVDGKTVKDHLYVLERLFLVRIRPAWHVNLGKRQVKAPKIYVADSGLLAGLLRADKQRVRKDGGFAGALFETFVATELERQASWFPEPLTFWHYRDDGREVDVVVERPSGEIVGVEVKASATVRAKDFSGLKHLRDSLGERFRAGAVLYCGSQTLPAGNRLWAVPLSGLWS